MWVTLAAEIDIFDFASALQTGVLGLASFPFRDTSATSPTAIIAPSVIYLTLANTYYTPITVVYCLNAQPDSEYCDYSADYLGICLLGATLAFAHLQYLASRTGISLTYQTILLGIGS